MWLDNNADEGGYAQQDRGVQGTGQQGIEQQEVGEQHVDSKISVMILSCATTVLELALRLSSGRLLQDPVTARRSGLQQYFRYRHAQLGSGS